jgi:hypothetical protein
VAAATLGPVAWFQRKAGKEDPQPEPDSSSGKAWSPFTTVQGVDDTDELPLRPVAKRLGPEEESLIARALEELAAGGVDVNDLDSLGSAYDQAFRAWRDGQSGEDYDRIVQRFAVGIGEHLNRRTDLDWQVVTDAFGTDLAVFGGGRGDFVVVPSNLVAARWMTGETGWIPGVVGHLVVRRTRR